MAEPSLAHLQGRFVNQLKSQCEFVALSRLMLLWAQPGRVAKRELQLNAIANAILPDVGNRKRGRASTERIPGELVVSEYEVLRSLLEGLPLTGSFTKQKWIVGTLPEIFSSAGLSDRYVLLPAVIREELNKYVRKLPANSRWSRKEIAGHWASMRFAESVQYDTIRRKTPRANLASDAVTCEHKLLASMFLDVVRINGAGDVALKLLDVLGATRYPPLQLFYLVRKCDAEFVDATEAVLEWCNRLAAYCDRRLKELDRDRAPAFQTWSHQ